MLRPLTAHCSNYGSNLHPDGHHWVKCFTQIGGNSGIISRHFVFFFLRGMKRVKTFWNYIKPLVRSTVDTYLLPGAVTGSEICWLYMIQWRKETYTITITLLALLFYNLDVSADSQMYSSQTVVGNENIAMDQKMTATTMSSAG